MPTTWNGCYDDSWKGEIVEEAFAHPAKMARGLVRRIFDYLLETGRLKRGDVVIDPFGGIGTTGLEGASRGVRCFACELEPRFVELAKANIELHRRTWEAFGDPLPVIVQGDSRRLCEVLGPLLADCVVGSPPFCESLSGRGECPKLRPDGSEFGQGKSIDLADYGTTPGQLGAMPSGSVDAVVGSPPFREQQTGGGIANAMNGGAYGLTTSKPGVNCGYQKQSTIDGNLAAEKSDDTFWEAAKTIVSQCHAILKPGGVCVWVCKDFVRAKKRVPFSADWVRLCEAEGFRLVEWIEASLVKTDSHPSLFGGEETKTTERKSFFRRLAERKGSPRIDHEDVLVMKKRGSNA